MSNEWTHLAPLLTFSKSSENVIRKAICLPNFAEKCQSFGTGSLLTFLATLLTMVTLFLIFCFHWFYQKEVEITGNFVIVRYNNVRELKKEVFVQYSASAQLHKLLLFLLSVPIRFWLSSFRFGYFVFKQPRELDYTDEGPPVDACSPTMSLGRGPYRYIVNWSLPSWHSCCLWQRQL